MRELISGVLTILVLMGWACAGDRGAAVPAGPTPITVDAPRPTTTAPQPSAPGELWRLTTTIVGLEGSACFWTHPVGATFDNWTLSVERNGANVRFIYDVNNPHDNALFVGAVNGSSFTAASDIYRSSWACSGAVSISTSVAGSFAPDGRALSGRERLVYRVEGGSELIVSFEWSAVRM
jgi:hypothetical protein